ncbi:hypothetical protein [Stenotrophomonas maltophilia]|uniref:hypothetical protein n=1 Tax=Stenotrophomonas maltophilia TaxID=40324 RepID=UPI000B4CF6EB|nr:hypothetical protein [Stenotrophomonas maltophilia]OWQ68451.1 hypothetical protein CEE58_01125 [Stenotrophomonas maltophilia]
MGIQTPLIINQVAGRIEELAAGDTLPGPLVEGYAGGNVLINGDFDFWQRGDQFSNSNVYTADRWYVQQGNVSGQLFWKHTPLAGETNFPDSTYTFAINITGNTSATSAFQVFEQRVEDCRTFATKVSTLSFRVFNGGASGRKIAVEFGQTFGAGGSAAVLGISPEVFTLAAGMNYITKTVTMPSVGGKTANFGHAAVVIIWSSAGSDFNSRTANLGLQTGSLYFSQMKWEPGAVATPFRKRELALELVLCQRYYEKSYMPAVSPGTIDNQGRRAFAVQPAMGGFLFCTQGFLVQKRATPSITVYTAPGGVPGSVAQDDGSARAVTVANQGVSSFELQWSNSAGRYGGWYHFTADAEI